MVEINFSLIALIRQAVRTCLRTLQSRPGLVRAIGNLNYAQLHMCPHTSLSLSLPDVWMCLSASALISRNILNIFHLSECLHHRYNKNAFPLATQRNYLVTIL